MVQGQVLRRSAGRVPEDPRAFWLARMDEASRPACESQFDRFVLWLRKKPGWERVTPRELVVRHLEAEDPYTVLDLVQMYVNEALAGKRKSSKRKGYTVIRSF